MTTYVNQSTFDSLGIELSGSDKEYFERVKTELHEIWQIIPDAELMYRVYYDERSARNIHEGMSIGFVRDQIQFFIHKQSIGRKPDYLISIDTHEFEYTDTYDREKAKRELEKPNDIHVLTEKKVMAWVAYYQKYYANLRTLDHAHKKTITAFRALLATLPDVQWMDKNRGEIRRNGLRYTFRIETTRIVEKIELSGYKIDSIRNFLLLADNKYINPEK